MFLHEMTTNNSMDKQWLAEIAGEIKRSKKVYHSCAVAAILKEAKAALTTMQSTLVKEVNFSVTLPDKPSKDLEVSYREILSAANEAVSPNFRIVCLQDIRGKTLEAPGHSVSIGCKVYLVDSL
jgi:hypothetical protein